MNKHNSILWQPVCRIAEIQSCTADQQDNMYSPASLNYRYHIPMCGVVTTNWHVHFENYTNSNLKISTKSIQTYIKNRTKKLYYCWLLCHNQVTAQKTRHKYTKPAFYSLYRFAMYLSHYGAFATKVFIAKTKKIVDDKSWTRASKHTHSQTHTRNVSESIHKE